MLRALVALLLLANICFYAWTEGWLDSVVGVRAIGDREPERLDRQVRPESVRILPENAAASAPAVPVVLSCLEAGPFNDAEVGAAQSAAQAAGLPAGSWATIRTDKPGVWIVYMGKYANREALGKKEEELNRRHLHYEEMRDNPALAPGLALGRFDDKPAATRALEQFSQQGIRTARVVELSAPSNSHLLRIEKADPGLANQVANLKSAALGKGFTACANPAS
jgi:hypothetical protein